jgi:putative spermidine/putrescine transport system permease protein
MRERGAAGWVLAASVVVPLSILVVWSVADAWRAPALWPQEVGLRGFRVALSASTRAGVGLVNSLVVALAATLLALLLGWPAARALGSRQVRRPILASMLLAMPLFVPGYATGTGLAEWFLRLGLADRLSGLVLAHLVYVLPYVVLLLAPAFGVEVQDLEEAARSLGAGWLRRLLRVTVPAVRPALAVAVLIAFLVSWSQYGTSLAVGGGLPMLPLVLLPFVPTDPQVAAALSLLFLAPVVAALAVAVRAGRGPLGYQ